MNPDCVHGLLGIGLAPEPSVIEGATLGTINVDTSVAVSKRLGAIYENRGLNLANLTDEQQIEAKDDYRIRIRRGSEQEAKPKTRQRKILPVDDE